MHKVILFIRYYIKRIIKNLFYSSLVYILFGISILLMLLIVFPSLSNRLPFYRNRYKIYNIHGSIQIDTTYNNSTIIVEIGSSKTIVQTNHSFNLSFPSKTKDSIPIIFTIKDKKKQFYKVKRINLKEIDNNMNFSINGE